MKSICKKTIRYNQIHNTHATIALSQDSRLLASAGSEHYIFLNRITY